jgi:serine/threonine protein kinase
MSSLKEVIKKTCARLGDSCDYKKARMYNKKGIILQEGDYELIANGDILYCALRGEDFNYAAILDDYEMGKTLGVGGFGKVILAKHRETRKEMAIKFTDVSESLSSANLIQAIYKEAESLKALTHKHIVKLHQAFIDGKQFIMIMEVCHGGELLDKVKKNKHIPEPLARNIILQVIQAMLYCHSRGTVHRDLKLENVLFCYRQNDDEDDDHAVKVVDFGIAGMGDDKVDAGTLAYMAPECLEKVAASTSPAIDVWAIGIMLFTMIFGFLPFYASNEKDLIRRIKEEPLKFPKDYPITSIGKEVLRSMLTKDPAKRIQLIDFVTLDYNTMSEGDFCKHYQEAEEVHALQKHKSDAEEEAKQHEQIMAKLDLEQKPKSAIQGGLGGKKLAAPKSPKGKRDRSTGK